MKQIVITLVALSLNWSALARAQDAGGLVVTRAASRPSRVAPAENFTGTARVQPLFDTTTSTRAYGASVSFEAGARTARHTHPRGQVLVVTEGVGRVQRWGAPVEEIRPGDVVRIPPGAKHWHGASPTTAMTHIAIVEHSGGRSVEWLEHVSDAQYSARPGAQGAAPAAPARGVAGDSVRPSVARQLMGDIAPKLAQFTHECSNARTVLLDGECAIVLRTTKTSKSCCYEQHECGTRNNESLQEEVALDVRAQSGLPGRSLP